MSRPFPRFRLLPVLTLTTLLGGVPRPFFAAELLPDTVRAYEKYVQAAQARMAREEQLPQRFLHLESLPLSAQRSIWTTLKGGGVWLDSLDATDERGKDITAPRGTITHWVGAVFFPGISLDQALGVLEDFDHFQNIYKPEIVRSRLVSREGDTFHASFRIHKDTPWVNPTYNLDSAVTVARLDANHARVRTTSTRIAQVEDAGKPTEHEDSVGRDGGYLWRLNADWRLQERDGGVVAEWEAITLSRDIPFLLRWLVRPFVERLARQTVRDEMIATRDELARRARAARTQP